MIIGHMAATATGFAGEIKTMTLTMAVQVVPHGKGAGDIGPTHKVYSGDIEIGAAWERHESGQNFYRLRLDDPAFASPVDGTLLRAPSGEWVVEWYRPGTARYSRAA